MAAKQTRDVSPPGPVLPQAPPGAIAEIERLGYKWHLVSAYDLDQLSKERRVQVRETDHYAPRETVELYAVQMGQSQFPPIVVTLDDWLIDGNTREGALRKRDQRHFPAIVVEIEYAGRSTTSKTQQELRALARTLNSQHGVRLTAKEARDGARDMIALNWKAEQIARALGLRPTAIGQIKKEITAENRLESIGFRAHGLNGAALRKLGSADALALNNAPFEELSRLSAEAGYNAQEIETAAKDVRAVGSEAGQMEKLAALRVEAGDRIRERQLTGRGKPAPSRMLRQHLGYVNKFTPATAHEMLETDPAVQQTAVEALRAAIPVLIAVYNMQLPSGTPPKTDWSDTLAS